MLFLRHYFDQNKLKCVDIYQHSEIVDQTILAKIKTLLVSPANTGDSWSHQVTPRLVTNSGECQTFLSENCDNQTSLHYGKVSMGGATFRILNFASHFIRV